ncbi:MAG: 16S rRNA (guanine(527)-N(7))-methyltransferase RsmG [Betaproteobacteria bacterium]|nr:16S rRNA (guanine(527)-N(7))-methyltransferase RsmG [Betaproteobacteria bacterium]
MSAETLASGVTQLGIELPDGAAQTLLAYLELITKWNQVYNLTAIRDPQRTVVEHVLDSLAIMPHVVAPRVLDVGTGAGLPGVPLAIARPAWRIVLLDSSHKRCSFLQQAAIELRLNNVEVACERVESYRPAEPFTSVVSRAFSDTAHFARVALPLVAQGGTMLAMKGLYPHEELAQLAPEVALKEVVALAVPGLDAQRHLVVMTKA